MANVFLIPDASRFWNDVVMSLFPAVANEHTHQMFEIAITRSDPEWRVYKAAFGRIIGEAYPGYDVYAEIGFYLMQQSAPWRVWTQEDRNLAYTAFSFDPNVSKADRQAALDEIDNLIGQDALSDAMNGAMGGRAS